MKYLQLLCVIVLVPWIVAFAPHDEDTAHDAASNAEPVGNGVDGPFASRNVEILGHLTIDEMGGGPANIVGNDCWGWTDPQTGKEYALVGLTHGTSFVDISDPSNPLYLGRLPTQNGVSTWRDMKVFNDYAFVVADGIQGHGMQVFDLTNLRTADPKNPQEYIADVYHPDSGDAHNIAINEDTGYAYIVGGGVTSGLFVVDIQDPLNPTNAGTVSDGYTHDVVVVSYNGPDPDYAGKEIAFACNTSGADRLSIFDVTDKENMSLISFNAYPESGYAHQCWITEDHRYIYLGDEFDEGDLASNTRIIVFDCLDLDNPQYLGYYLGETAAVDHNLFVLGDKIFQANYTAGMRVLSIDPNDPVNLTEIGFVDTYPLHDLQNYNGAWACWPFYESGNIIINDRQNGLFIVRLMEVEFKFPDDRPDFISVDGGEEFVVEVISGIDGTPEPGTGVLHVDRGNGFETFPMTELSENVYQAAFPSMPCNLDIRYYVSAMSANGVVETSPPDAPTNWYTARSATSTVTSFDDNFESDMGWTVKGDARSGHWERGIPLGGFGIPAMDADGSGSCYVTGNDETGEIDVDNGTTVLTSPMFDALGEGSVGAILQYHRWYSQFSSIDEMLVEVSNDNGESWIPLETIGFFSSRFEAWVEKSYDLDDYVERSDEMRVRFTVGDLEDDSLVEAGLDGVKISLIHCDDVLLGDVNLDGTVNLLDVAPFIDLLNVGEFQAEADINGDGAVDLLDVDPFVTLLSG